MLRRGFCRTATLLSPLFTELVDRLDSFEEEFIELRAFRKAVEATSPQVADVAKQFLKDHLKEVKHSKTLSDNPLTSHEFTELNQFYAKQKLKVIPCQNLLYINTQNDLIQHTEMVLRQFLVRIARRARQLNNAPYGLSQMPAIQEQKKWYQWSFHDIRNTPLPTDKEGCYRCDRMVRRVFLRHQNVTDLITRGLLEFGNREGWKATGDEAMHTYEELQHFFENFCLARLRLRFLLGHYVYLSSKILNVTREQYARDDPEHVTEPDFYDHDPADFAGQICKKCSLFTLAKRAVTEAQKNYDAEIELKLVGEANLFFVGAPLMTHEVISAMLEDAIGANLDHQELFGRPCSSIEVTLAQTPGNKQFVLRISDTAGGMTLRETRLHLSCWSFFKNAQISDHELISGWKSSPMRLPYAYCAARVIGGNLTVASIEGYGTDRQLYLPSTGLLGVSM